MPYLFVTKTEFDEFEDDDYPCIAEQDLGDADMQNYALIHNPEEPSVPFDYERLGVYCIMGGTVGYAGSTIIEQKKAKEERHTVPAVIAGVGLGLFIALFQTVTERRKAQAAAAEAAAAAGYVPPAP